MAVVKLLAVLAVIGGNRWYLVVYGGRADTVGRHGSDERARRSVERALNQKWMVKLKQYDGADFDSWREEVEGAFTQRNGKWLLEESRRGDGDLQVLRRSEVPDGHAIVHGIDSCMRCTAQAGAALTTLSSMRRCTAQSQCSPSKARTTTAAFGRARPLVAPLGVDEARRSGDRGKGMGSR